MIPNNLKAVIKTIQKLRDPVNGCPWDLKQDHRSLIPYLLEESYEYIDAIERNDLNDMKDELGDVLLQVLLHSTIAEQSDSFNLDEVAANLNEKLIRRHPHVFDKSTQLSPDEVHQQWKKIKENEKKGKVNKSRMKNKLLHNPSLESSYQIGLKSSEVNFDWNSPQEVFNKVKEELDEFSEAYESQDTKHMEEELGDLFFSLAQFARHLKFNPEKVLKKANAKFLRRFQSMESIAQEKELVYEELSSQQKEQLWKEVKENEDH